MLTLPPSVQLYVATQPVDARKSFNGLSLYVQSVLRLSPLSGHLFIFFNKGGELPSDFLAQDHAGHCCSVIALPESVD